MSNKRGGSDLNHENWNQEIESEEAGTFKQASEGEIKGRIIKRARRRNAGTEVEDGAAKKNVFAGFGGFAGAKPAAEAFSFLGGGQTSKASDSSKLGGAVPPASTAAGGFLFGSVAKPTASSAGFSFGTSSSSASGGDDSSKTKPSFVFGATSVKTDSGDAPKDTAVSSPFGSFGAVAAADKGEADPAAGSNLFGGFSGGAEKKPASTPAFGGFTFGAKKDKDNTSSGEFSKADNVKNVGSKSEPAVGSFKFGSASTSDVSSAPAISSAGFSFGSGASKPAESKTSSTMSVFGSKATIDKSDTSSSLGGPASFSFGVKSAGDKTSVSGTVTESKSLPGFSFGSKSDEKPSGVSGFSFASQSATVAEPIKSQSNAPTTVTFVSKCTSESKTITSEASKETFTFGSSQKDDGESSSFSFGVKSMSEKSSDDKPSTESSSFASSSQPKEKITNPSGILMAISDSTKEKVNPLEIENTVKETPSKEYLGHLKALNLQVLSWLKQHIDSNPFIILSPVFKDYDEHLDDITSKYGSPKADSNISSSKATPKSDFLDGSNPSSGISSGKTSTSLFSFAPNSSEAPSAPFSFGNVAAVKPTVSSSSGFGGSVFGSAMSSSSGTAGGFSFGAAASSTTTTTTGEAPAAKETEEEDDSPPVVEVKPVQEDDALYSKKCKLFYKKDGSYVEKGVGMLHLKSTEGGKTQLLVRADTNLGNVLLNILLTAQIPTTRVGKNNVMLVCVPNPPVDPKEDSSSPCPMLIRVKSGEDADELKEKLDELKQEH